MMNKHPLSLMRDKISMYLKYFAVSAIGVLCTTFIVYFCTTYTLAYAYYQISDEQQLYIGASKSGDLIEDTIAAYSNEWVEDGFNISEIIFNPEKNILNQKILIKKENTNDEEGIIDIIKKNLDITITAIQIQFENEDIVYIFKNENDSNTFIQSLNEYIEQKYTQKTIECKKENLTTDDMLQLKLDRVKTQKAELDAAAILKKRTSVVASRSGGTAVRYNVPMATYVYISSYFGYRSSGYHHGVDFAAKTGTEIYAWKDGVIIKAEWSGNYGNCIEVQHADGTITRYAHLSDYNCKVGDKVTSTTTIGYVGSTGNSTGPHLHFEIIINGNRVNPLPYLKY